MSETRTTLFTFQNVSTGMLGALSSALCKGMPRPLCGTLTLLTGRKLPLCLSVVLFHCCPFACFSFFQCLDNKENSP